MTIVVELLRRDLVELTLTPSVVRRVLFGERTQTRFAARCGAGWAWDDTGRLVDWATSRAIDAALRGAA